MRNPIIPFVLIMVLGVAGMFLMSFKGLGDMDKIAAEQENGGEEQAGDSASASPEEVFNASCAGCHATGAGGAPAVEEIANNLSVEEMVEIIKNGTGGGMPGGLIPGQEEAVAEWISSLK